jgi:hypothetical protein
MVNECLLPCSQEPANSSHLELDKSNLYPTFFNIHSHIIISSHVCIFLSSGRKLKVFRLRSLKRKKFVIIHFYVSHLSYIGARSREVCCGTMLQAGRLRVRFPMPLDFSIDLNPSRSTMALGSTQPLTE